MKTKLIAAGILLCLSVALYSFKNMAEKESSSVALINSVFGKDESEGFLIQYGDGSMEIKPFDFKNRSENFVQSVSMMATVMNVMHGKGYRYVGIGSHTSNDVSYAHVQYMVFEKN